MRAFRIGILLPFFALFLATPANAQDDARPDFAVYQGKKMNLSLVDALGQIKALPEIAYIDPAMTNEFTEKPVHDAEKIIATDKDARLEFWSDDSVDGMALESSFTFGWRQLCCDSIFVVNDPENAVDYQIQGFTGGKFIIANSFRNMDNTGHLAPLETGDPDNMFTFDNAGNLAQAEHIADLLTTVIDLSAAEPDRTANANFIAPQPATPAPGPYAYPATSYFEGNFAIRVAPQPDGSAAVNVINISSKPQNVSVAVTNCQNIADAACGAKFKGSLSPGMALSFPVTGENTTQPWDFHVDAVPSG